MRLLYSSLYSSVLIILIIVLRAILVYRIPKKIFKFAWGAVLFRLLFPFSIVEYFEKIMLDKSKDVTFFVTQIQDFYIRSANNVIGQKNFISVDNQGVFLKSIFMQYENVFLMIWVLGFVFCVIFFILGYLRGMQCFKGAVLADTDFIKNWKEQHTLKRTIIVKISDKIFTPISYGILKPIVLLPSSFDVDDIQSLNYILTHEYMHIKGFDILLKKLMMLAVSIHWFNPVVWLAFVFLNRDIELACDEAVLNKMGKECRKDYACLLIDMEEQKAERMLLCNGFSKYAKEERIVAIMKIRRNVKLAFIASAFFIGSAGVAFAANEVGMFKLATTSSNIVTHETEAYVLVDENGESLYSSDGHTWMDENEFKNDLPSVEYWKYDEYEKYISEKKEELMLLVNSENTYLKNGRWVKWTIEDVEEAIKVYESNLEEIKNGAKISKSVNGDDSTGMYQTPIDQDDISIDEVYLEE